MLDFAQSYNNSHHKSIGCTPNCENNQNQEKVLLKLYADLKSKKTKFKIYDLVRLTITSKNSTKAYFESYRRELFRLEEAQIDDPPFYRIRNLNDEKIQSVFYEHELKRVQSDGVFEIERILRRRKSGKGREFLIQWADNPDSFNSWVKEKDLVSYA